VHGGTARVEEVVGADVVNSFCHLDASEWARLKRCAASKHI
jgi:hypothetical protein